MQYQITWNELIRCNSCFIACSALILVTFQNSLKRQLETFVLEKPIGDEVQENTVILR